MIVPKATTDVTLYFKLVDPVAGTPETALVITNLDLSYVRDLAAAIKADLTALALVTSAHGDNKAIEVDATNCPGLYRVDVPDAAFATGVDHVQICINGAAIDPAYIEVELGVLEDIWGHATRTLTQTGVSIAAAVAGGLVTIQRGDSFTATFTGLADSTGISKMWFTVKRCLADPDTAAIIQIEHTTGLIYLNGTAVPAARNANGTLVDTTTTSATVTLDEVETDDLVPEDGLYYDIQLLTAAGAVTTLTTGPCNIVGDVSRVVA